MHRQNCPRVLKRPHVARDVHRRSFSLRAESAALAPPWTPKNVWHISSYVSHSNLKTDMVGAAPIETVRLPVHCLRDLTRADNDTWNIVKVGFGKDNQNQSIEGTDHDARCVVRYPKGSVNPSAKGRPVGGIGFYACTKAIFPANDVQLSYRLKFAENFDPAQVCQDSNMLIDD